MQSYQVKIHKVIIFIHASKHISFNAILGREQALELNKDFYLILRFFPFQLVITQSVSHKQ